MTKTAASQFIDAKLESTKSVKNDMTDQQQNFNDITDSFNMPSLLASLNEASFNEVSLSKASLNEASSNEVSLSKASLNEVSSSDSKAAELPALYQCLDCSCVNI